MDDLLSAVATAIREARRLLFITGAGISADSGLPTYRGIGGLYTDSESAEGMPIEELLSGAQFKRRPDVTWKYLHQLERASRGAAHNAAHRFIAGREASHDVVTVLTQNVDGFHRDAGSSDVIDIHGDIKALVCTMCEWARRVDDFAALEELPKCPDCGAVIRPDVVLFGEMLDPRKVDRLAAALDAGFDLVFAVGTTAVFPYIAGPVLQAARTGVPTVEINPDRTVLSDVVKVRLPLGAVEAFEALTARL